MQNAPPARPQDLSTYRVGGPRPGWALVPASVVLQLFVGASSRDLRANTTLRGFGPLPPAPAPSSMRG